LSALEALAIRQPFPHAHGTIQLILLPGTGFAVPAVSLLHATQHAATR